MRGIKGGSVINWMVKNWIWIAVVLWLLLRKGEGHAKGKKRLI